MTITIEHPEATTFDGEGRALVLLAKESFPLITAENVVQAKECFRDLRAWIKGVNEAFEPSRSAAHAAHKAVCALNAKAIAVASEFEVTLGGKIKTWDVEQARLAEIERRRLEVEARKAEEERRLQAAIEAESRGDVFEASDILEDPVTVPVIPVAKPVSVAGVSNSTSWKAVVEDKKAFIRWLGQNPETWQHLVDVNQSALNAAARAHRENLKIPGVRVYPDVSLVTRRM